MKKISANFIFPINSAPIANGVIITNEGGEVLDVLQNDEGLEDVLHVEGFLCPGFVNAHCHLELSHLKGLLPEKQGLLSFISPVINIRKANKEIIDISMNEAELEMRDAGIVAVGDICNTADSFKLKSQSQLQYHSYIEVIALDPSRAVSVFDSGKALQDKATEIGIQSSMVPHAPYTASNDLLHMLGDRARKLGAPLCIHNQESIHENTLFQDGTGPLKEFYSDHLGVDFNYFEPTGTNSMEAALNGLGDDLEILMVHNTYTSDKDLLIADSRSAKISYCLCPNANLYIEDTLPDLKLFRNKEDEVMLGTDSLSSNWSLSILEEMKTIVALDSGIELQMLLKWGTRNGANYLGFGDQLGTFEAGKRPGVNLIYNVDIDNVSLTDESQVKVLV